MTGRELELLVSLVEVCARLAPGAITIGRNIYDAIASNGELSDEQKATLRARVEATAAEVAAYRPRPIPDPPPTAPG